MDPRLFLTIASTAAGIFALCRLCYLSLWREYPWFIAYLAISSAQALIFIGGSPGTRTYAELWGITMPIVLVLRIAIVIELWRVLMRQYPGLVRGASFLLVSAAVVAMLFSLLTAFDAFRLFSFTSMRLGFRILGACIRYTASALCVIAACLALFAVVFPKDVPRNVLRHSWLTSCYFATIAAGYFGLHFLPLNAAAIGAVMTGSSAAIYVLWGVTLTRRGQREPFSAIGSFTPGELRTIQLNSDGLLEAGRYLTQHRSLRP